MNKFKSLLLGFATIAAILIPFNGFAQNTDEPIISFRTNLYDMYGETNEFSIVIGGTTAEGYIDVDCGYGKIEYELEQAVFDEDTQGITGTFISGKVSKDGIVKIYGDAQNISYINADGCYIEWIDMDKCVNLSVLSMSHNELKRLDLTNFKKLMAIYLNDNPFTAETPLIIGKDKPELSILEISIVDYLDPAFNLSDYPKMLAFDGYHCTSLKYVDPTGCPNLMRLSIDVTPVKTIDVTKNPNLLILNISDTGIEEVDLSKNPYLTELYCTHESGSYNNGVKIKELDITHNPDLQYLFCSNNALTTLDITKCPKLINLYASNNYLTSIDVSQCPNLYNVKINGNCMDFNTIPLDPGTWGEYEYGQRPFEVAKSFKVGDKIDMSARVMRTDGSTTDGALYLISEYNPSSPSLLDDSYYSYENGVITLKKAVTDSVYVAYANSALPNAILSTTKFMVKTEKEFGKPSKAVSFNTTVSSGSNFEMSIGLEGATTDSPREFFIDLGDGNLESFKTSVSYIPSEPNIKVTKKGYGPVSIYLPENELITALAVKDIYITTIDVTKASSLRELSLVNTQIYSIDLSWNKTLRTLNLSGNNLYSLTLAGINEIYTKTMLHTINLSKNNLTDLTLNSSFAIHNLDISNNSLAGIDFSDFDYIETLNIANNKFESIDLTHCTALQSLNISGNSISSIILPEENNIKSFNCANNKFTLETLPQRWAIDEANYIYAPQSDYVIATKGPGANLTNLNRIIDGTGTTFVWKKADGTPLTEGVDYTNNNGRARFLNTTVGKIYCEMTHPAFPAFSSEKVYKTTQILAAEMPTNKIASFKTLNDGDAVTLSLAAEKAGTAIYIDWVGDNDVEQYLLGTTYSLFSATTKAGAEVGVYTYEPTEYVTVFSMTGAKLESFDGTGLEKASTITVKEAGISSITIPTENVRELILDDNAFTEFSPAKYPNLVLLSMNHNSLSKIDLSQNKNLHVASLGYNQLSEINLDNPNLWALYMSNNLFETINLNGAKELQQLDLGHNLLRTLDVSGLTKLLALAINQNYFTFSTLPYPKSTYAVYHYQDQAKLDVAEIDGKIDLSSEAVVSDNNTEFTWFYGVPEKNDYGEWEGEILLIDTEYTLENGVTTFLKPFDEVVGMLTNPLFPSLTLFTPKISVEGAGVEGVQGDEINAKVVGNTIVIKSDAGLKATLHNIGGALVNKTTTVDGTTTITNVAQGVYLLNVGNKVFKLLVK